MPTPTPLPPWAVGKQVVVKADQETLSIYLKEKLIATHQRSWERKQRIELPEHREAVLKGMRRQWQSEEVALFASLREEARGYLEHIAAARLPLRKNVSKLLVLKDRYGLVAFLASLQKALINRAFGAHYVENILVQDHTPSKDHPLLQLKEERLNRIRLEEPNLAEFDAFVLRKGK